MLLVISPFSFKSTAPVTNVVIYSGSCSLYKRTFVPPNHISSQLVSKSFGKLVISRSPKSFNFYYDGKLVFSRKDFDSYEDTNQGGEGYTSYNGINGHRLTAERVVELYVTDILNPGDMGYQYEITNYKVN